MTQQWLPMSCAPLLDRKTSIICIGRDAWPQDAPERQIAECVRSGSGWTRSNGYGFLVGFYPRAWIPRPGTKPRYRVKAARKVTPRAYQLRDGWTEEELDRYFPSPYLDGCRLTIIDEEQ